MSLILQVTLACFGAYVTVSTENVLTSSKAFTSLSLFNILRFPMNLLPMMISYIVTVSTAVLRVYAIKPLIFSALYFCDFKQYTKILKVLGHKKL